MNEGDSMSVSPKISVVMISYNHEKYIGEAINSILSQSFPDFELIIVDDGSTDNTLKIIREYQDPRVFIVQEENSGPSIALNTGIIKSQGKYIAIMSGDDVSLPDRLMKQIEQIELQKADMIFGLPQLIGPDSNNLIDNICPWFFSQEFNSTAELYQLLFYTGNFLCAPSFFGRRKAVEKVGMFKRGLIQLQDFDYWIRACKKNLTIKLCKDRIIQYRYLFGENLSDERNMNRVAVESLSIYRSFFDDAPVELLHKAFDGKITLDALIPCPAIDVDISFLYLGHSKARVQTIGIERLIKQLDNDQTYRIITTEKDFSTNRLFQLMLSSNTDQLDSTSKFKKNLKQFRKMILNILGRLTTVYPVWTESQVKKQIDYYLENGDNKRAILVAHGYRKFPPGPTIFATFIKVIDKTSRIFSTIVVRLIYNFFGGIVKLKNLFRSLYNKPPVIERVYTLSRMYDYCKQENCIFYEETQEKIVLKKPEILGDYTGNLNGGEIFPPIAYISTLENAIITGGSSLVVTQSEDLLSDEMFDFGSDEFGIKSPFISYRNKNKVIMTYQKKPHTKLKSGIVISCDHDNNYFHWLVECLPKLLFVDICKNYYSYPLLIPSGLHENLKMALYRLNINNHPIICLDPGTAYHVNHMIFPSALSRVIDRYMGQAVFGTDIVLSQKWVSKVGDLLRKNEPSNKKPWRKLYLTRRKGARALGNQMEIELVLTENGFEIIELDDASLDYQIELFSQASVIVAPTGAALTNMLLCQLGTKVIIFMSNHETTNFYFWSNLGRIAKVDVKIIVGERLFNLTNYWSVHDDYSIDPETLRKEIENIE